MICIVSVVLTISMKYKYKQTFSQYKYKYIFDFALQYFDIKSIFDIWSMYRKYTKKMSRLIQTTSVYHVVCISRIRSGRAKRKNVTYLLEYRRKPMK